MKSVLAAVAVAAALASCGRTALHDRAAPESPTEVRIVRAGVTAGEPLVVPARVMAREEVTVTARLAARLTALPFREGDRFRRGQVLARFDSAETRAALESARAALDAAAFRRDVARLQEARMESLYAARVAALHELEGAGADRRAAEASWAEARATADQIRSGVAIEAAELDGIFWQVLLGEEDVK